MRIYRKERGADIPHEEDKTMDLITVKELFRQREDYFGKTVSVGGWVRSNRDSKNFGFLVINDGTYFETLQVVYRCARKL